MARKDLPYLPLYVQDFLTDEKLMECSASATGVYIRIMCVLHKCNPYGRFLLKQKDKQSEQQILNFATKFALHLPYDFATITSGLEELINEDCLQINGDYLEQKRMVEDAALSLTRSKTGSKGGKATQKSRLNFAKGKLVAKQAAKRVANADIDIDTNNINNNGIEKQKIIKVKVNGLGEMEFNIFNCGGWEMKELEKFLKSSHLQFEGIAMRNKVLKDKNNFHIAVQSFIDMIQTSVKYQEAGALATYFGNWIDSKQDLKGFIDSKKQAVEKAITPEEYFNK